MKVTTLRQAAQLLNLPFSHEDKPITGFSVDTRTLKPGEVYVALKGERVDGHQFIAEAQAKGAAAALVSRHHAQSHAGLLLGVEDPLQALQEIAKRLIANWLVRIVAITGSVGKTTTKEFIKQILSCKYRVAASPGNSNSQVGTPLAILNHTTGQEEILILEMGMTHAGNLARLVQIAPPEVAVLTTTALVHACNFDSLESIGEAKAEIFSHPQTRLGLLHRDIINYADLVHRGHCHKLSFSTTSPEADYYLDFNEKVIQVRIEKQTIQAGLLPLPGRHNWHNFLAAAAVARHFNLSWDEIKQAMEQLQLPERRLQFVQHKGVLFLNDSYNASEISVKAALESLPAPEGKGHKIAVLGSMMELGPFSDDCHQRIGEFALQCVDRLFCLGQECQPALQAWQTAGKPAQLFLDRKKLVESLREVLQPSDVVLLKGSRSKELWKVLEEI